MTRFVTGPRLRTPSLIDTCRIAANRAATCATASSRIGYIGAQGFRNLGDDAMFEAIKRLLPGRTVIPYSEPWHERRLRRVRLGGPRFFDSVVLGGGTMINPHTLYIVQEALRQGTRLWSLGTGVGSCGFRQPENVDITEWRPLLTEFDGIGVRGPRSRDALRAIGLDNVQVVGDLALALVGDELAGPTAAPRVLLNAAGPAAHIPEEQAYASPEYERLDDVSVALKSLVRQGWTVVPVAMNETDIPTIQKTLAAAGLPAANITVPSTAAEFFAVASPCRFAVAVRLHAAVLACCAGVPPLMIGYRPKCEDFMESMELQEWNMVLAKTQRGEIARRISDLARCSVELRSLVFARAQAWRKRLREYVQWQLDPQGAAGCEPDDGPAAGAAGLPIR